MWVQEQNTRHIYTNKEYFLYFRCLNTAEMQGLSALFWNEESIYYVTKNIRKLWKRVYKTTCNQWQVCCIHEIPRSWLWAWILTLKLYYHRQDLCTKLNVPVYSNRSLLLQVCLKQHILHLKRISFLYLSNVRESGSSCVPLIA